MVHTNVKFKVILVSKSNFVKSRKILLPSYTIFLSMEEKLIYFVYYKPKVFEISDCRARFVGNNKILEKEFENGFRKIPAN